MQTSKALLLEYPAYNSSKMWDNYCLYININMTDPSNQQF